MYKAPLQELESQSKRRKSASDRVLLDQLVTGSCYNREGFWEGAIVPDGADEGDDIDAGRERQGDTKALTR
ncbi:hypothetical protein JCM16303_003446 [Sporobolomyces ruberrimus]